MNKRSKYYYNDTRIGIKFKKENIISEREKEFLIQVKNFQFWISKKTIFYKPNNEVVAYIDKNWFFDINYLEDDIIERVKGWELNQMVGGIDE